MPNKRNVAQWSASDKLAIALTCLAAVMALILFWIDKTPLAAGLSIAAMAGLLVYPVFHFVKRPGARGVVFSLLAILLAVFGWRIWPRAAYIATSNPPIPPARLETKELPPVPQPVGQRASAPKRAKLSSLQSGTVINAPNGIGISGGNVSNPTVNNEIHQSAVEISGSGTTSGVTIINPTVTGTPSGKESGSLISFDSSSGKISDFVVKDAHLCNFNSWDDFLDCVAADPTGVKGAVDYQRTLFVKHTNNANAEMMKRCIAQFDTAADELMSHQNDEAETIAKLRMQRPFCIKARPP